MAERKVKLICSHASYRPDSIPPFQIDCASSHIPSRLTPELCAEIVTTIVDPATAQVEQALATINPDHIAEIVVGLPHPSSAIYHLLEVPSQCLVSVKTDLNNHPSFDYFCQTYPSQKGQRACSGFHRADLPKTAIVEKPHRPTNRDLALLSHSNSLTIEKATHQTLPELLATLRSVRDCLLSPKFTERINFAPQLILYKYLLGLLESSFPTPPSPAVAPPVGRQV